jgi:hypothetical protein
MLFKKRGRVSEQTTAFREDGSAELLTIVKLEFDRCEFTSNSRFEPEEGLRLLLPGQGWIRVRVQQTSRELVGATFVTECVV